MASPAYAWAEAGTPITWIATGGTYALTLTSLASGSARQGVKSATLLDGTKGFPVYCIVNMTMQFTSAATNGGSVDIFMGESDSATAGTANPGGMTGTDAALSTPAEVTNLLTAIGAMATCASLTTAVHSKDFIYYPKKYYIMPAVVNNGSVAFDATAGHHIVTVTPYYQKITY